MNSASKVHYNETFGRGQVRQVVYSSWRLSKLPALRVTLSRMFPVYSDRINEILRWQSKMTIDENHTAGVGRLTWT